MDLLRYVRVKAGEAAQDARQDLEMILADEASSANSLLDAIRDLGELLELLEEEENCSLVVSLVSPYYLRFCFEQAIPGCIQGLQSVN